jgi:hypothetical protein
LRWKAKAKGAPKPSIAVKEYIAKSLAADNEKAARFWSEVNLFIVSHKTLGVPLLTNFSTLGHSLDLDTTLERIHRLYKRGVER